jgi:hypothetical protein
LFFFSWYFYIKWEKEEEEAELRRVSEGVLQSSSQNSLPEAQEYI